MMLDIYLILNILLQDFKENNDSYKTIDLYIKEIFNKLDPSIRIHLRKSGISLYRNTYTGYDSEYQRVNSMTNKLLSVQLSVCSKVLLKMPVVSKEYKLSKVDTLKGNVYKSKKISPKLDYDLLSKALTNRILKIRELNFKMYDESMEILQKGLKDLEVPFIEKERFITFKFNQSKISS